MVGVGGFEPPFLRNTANKHETQRNLQRSILKQLRNYHLETSKIISYNAMHRR